MPPRNRTSLALSALVALPLLAACSGTSCDELPRLQAQREAERRDYLDLVRSGAPGERTGAADDALHRLERTVYDLEQRCAD